MDLQTSRTPMPDEPSLTINQFNCWFHCFSVCIWHNTNTNLWICCHFANVLRPRGVNEHREERKKWPCNPVFSFQPKMLSSLTHTAGSFSAMRSHLTPYQIRYPSIILYPTISFQLWIVSHSAPLYKTVSSHRNLSAMFVLYLQHLTQTLKLSRYSIKYMLKDDRIVTIVVRRHLPTKVGNNGR